MMRFLRHSYTAVILGFLYLPIFILIVFSFNEPANDWSHQHSLVHFNISTQFTICKINLGFTEQPSNANDSRFALLAAYAIYREMKPWEKTISMNLTYVPLLNPDIVTGISLMLLFIFVKMKLGFGSLLLSHIIFNVPYVILTVLPKLKQFDRNLYDAALDLGASPAYAFRRIVLPEILPGILTGALFAFTLSVDDFVISFFTTGSGVNNLSILIYSMARRGIHPTINALSTLLFLTVLALLIAVNFRTEKRAESGE